MMRSQRYWIVPFLLAFACCSSLASPPNPQEPHYLDGSHNDKYVHDSSEKNDGEVHSSIDFTHQIQNVKLFQFSNLVWEGKEDSGHDMWSKEFPIESVAPGVGFLFTFGNIVVGMKLSGFRVIQAVDTSEGLVLFDTASVLFSQDNFDNIRKWSSKPVHTIVLTHGHVDHVFGIHPFDEEALKNNWTLPRVVSHEGVLPRFERYKMTKRYVAKINARQFEGEDAESLEYPVDFRYPDLTYQNNLTLTIGGMEFHLFHARGETDDATWVWIPKHQIVVTGDLFIWSAPNAGNPQKVQRYAAEWGQALRDMAKFSPKLLLPGHGPPLVGQERVYEALITTADFLQSLVDQTVELMNKGYTLNQIIHTVQVPEKYKSKTYLRPSYDEPEFIVRNVWRLYGGWWDLNPANLKPPRDDLLAQQMCNLAGGVSYVVAQAEALAKSDQLDLATSLIETAYKCAPQDIRVLKSYVAIFTQRAEHPSVTSLMARGIFRSAASEKRRALTKLEEVSGKDDWWSSLLQFFGFASQKEPKLSVKELDYSWMKHLNDPEGESHYRTAIRDAMWELREFTSGKGNWELILDETNLKGWKIYDDTGTLVIRGETWANFAAKDIFSLLVVPKYRHKWESRVDEEEVQVVDTRTTVRYRIFPKTFIVKERDFVYVAHWGYFAQDNEYCIAIKSVDHPKYPPKEDAYRTTVLSGFCVKQDLQHPNRSLIRCAQKIEAGLPDRVTQGAGVLMVRTAHKLGEILA